MVGGTALSIGNFDGVHRGHVALVAAARDAVGPGGRVVLLSFDPHPLTVLRPAAAPSRLSRIEQRRQWLLEAGADEVLVISPSRPLLERSPAEFMEGVVTEHRPSVVVEGPDFRFGRDRCGSVHTLQELGTQLDFAVRVIDPVEVGLDDQHLVRASSTIVRWLLDRGRVGDTARLLGRPYELLAEVVPGDRKGRELSMPTANLRHDDCQLPADGVYAGRGLGPDGRWYPAAISVGTKPTFGDCPRLCEAHLVGFRGEGDEYGWPLRLQFTAWLREQLAYPDVGALVAQMRRDVGRAVRLSGAEAHDRAAPAVTVTAAARRAPRLRKGDPTE
jgi:riboflavin kinase/FMN adenylyltransferase